MQLRFFSWWRYGFLLPPFLILREGRGETLPGFRRNLIPKRVRGFFCPPFLFPKEKEGRLKNRPSACRMEDVHEIPDDEEDNYG